MWLYKFWLNQNMIQPIIAPTFHFSPIYFFVSDKNIYNLGNFLSVDHHSV